MDQRVSFITLVVTDLEATRKFYIEGLGWVPEVDVPGEVLMFKVADKVVLSMWVESAFVAEVGHAPARGGVPPITLSQPGMMRSSPSGQPMYQSGWEPAVTLVGS